MEKCLYQTVLCVCKRDELMTGVSIQTVNEGRPMLPNSVYIIYIISLISSTK